MSFWSAAVAWHISHTLGSTTHDRTAILHHIPCQCRTVTYRSLCERTFAFFSFTVNNMGGESQNVILSLVADNTMLHQSLEVLGLENHAEPAEAATALDAIFTNNASVSMANEDDGGFDRS